MKLLAIDTATEALSVALYQNGEYHSEFALCPQQHSKKLLPLVEKILAEGQLSLNQLDGLVFGRGPGSFTGVRIATGMVQGLAFGAKLPVVGISTLAAMAQQQIEAHQASQVVCAIDARMAEVYSCQYQKRDNLAHALGEEQVGPPERLAQALPKDDYAIAGTGWAAYSALTDSQPAGQTAQVLYPNARYMLPLAVPEFNAGNGQDAMDITPVYVRDTVTWKKLPGRE